MGLETHLDGMFNNPHFTVWNIVYTAIGAAVFWGVWGRTKLKPYILSDVIELLPWKKYHPLLEFLMFLIIGCVVGIGFADPTNPRQALTAGFGWTGAIARRKPGI